VKSLRGVLAEDLGLNYVVPVNYGCGRIECKRFQGRICEPYDNSLFYY